MEDPRDVKTGIDENCSFIFKKRNIKNKGARKRQKSSSEEGEYKRFENQHFTLLDSDICDFKGYVCLLFLQKNRTVIQNQR